LDKGLAGNPGGTKDVRKVEMEARSRRAAKVNKNRAEKHQSSQSTFLKIPTDRL
jgi:hypothetical protein